MSQQALSDEVCKQTLQLWELWGRNTTLAAEKAGVSRGTFASRLKVATARFGKSQDFTPPILPDEDEDLESLIRRQEAEQERRRAHRSAVEWMPFKVHGGAPFCLAFIGDPHVDQCDIGLLRRHVELIEHTDRMWAVCLGDLANSWVGRLRGLYANQSFTERDAFRLVKWLLNKPIWMLVIMGNHDLWHGDGSPLKWMETAVAVPIQDWQAKFELACGEARWRVWAAHNFPGNSQFNANHGLDKRALQTGAMADIFVAGDRHTFKLSQDQHEHTGRIYWSARARGYKPLDLYAIERGYGEQNVGHSIGAVFDPKTGKLQCFADLFESASYLEFLKGRK